MSGDIVPLHLLVATPKGEAYMCSRAAGVAQLWAPLARVIRLMTGVLICAGPQAWLGQLRTGSEAQRGL